MKEFTTAFFEGMLAERRAETALRACLLCGPQLRRLFAPVKPGGKHLRRICTICEAKADARRLKNNQAVRRWRARNPLAERRARITPASGVDA